MEKSLYVMQIIKTKEYKKLNMEWVKKHVENLRTLDEEGKLELWGTYKGFPGVAGMVIFRVESLAKAKELCKQEPLVQGGYATFTISELQVANKENNYLL